MASTSRKAYGSTGGTDCMNLDPDSLAIAEDHPEHPEHASHVERTRLDDPDMIALIESIRANGTGEMPPIYVYMDGRTATIAEGRRRKIATSVVVAERKKARDKRSPLTLKAIITKDPVLARNIGNACRKEDPPMVLARRFVEAEQVMDPKAAAASLGLDLARANHLKRALTLAPEVQARINRLEIPIDVALRLGQTQSEQRATVKASTGEDGKIDKRKVRAAANGAPRRRVAGSLRGAVPIQKLEAAGAGMNDEFPAIALVLRVVAGQTSRARYLDPSMVPLLRAAGFELPPDAGTDDGDEENEEEEAAE